MPATWGYGQAGQDPTMAGWGYLTDLKITILNQVIAITQSAKSLAATQSTKTLTTAQSTKSITIEGGTE